VMQVGRVRPGAPPEHDVLHPVGGGLGQPPPYQRLRDAPESGCETIRRLNNGGRVRTMRLNA